MHLAGGIYQELCCVPEWNAVYGSGGRAALAISNLSNNVVLHTYYHEQSNPGLDLLKKHGVNVRITPRQTNIVFSYFHPLSKPIIQPTPSTISKHAPLHVAGESVLRFGFFEGDAVVNATRAVYDPQTSANPIPFSSNGSSAEELAIVLNEQEVTTLAGTDNIEKAALTLISRDGAKVVVVKAGIRGATIFENDGQQTHVPAFKSTRVFKIGTGDIFSAVFSLYWAEQKRPAGESANFASKAVASYCDTRRLPLTMKEVRNLRPATYCNGGAVLILGKVETLGQRYTMEEARFVLNDLGINVVCPELGYTSSKKITAVLIMADGLGNDFDYYTRNAQSYSVPIVMLMENKSENRDNRISIKSAMISDDFSSAIYHSAWSTCDNPN